MKIVQYDLVRRDKKRDRERERENSTYMPENRFDILDGGGCLSDGDSSVNETTSKWMVNGEEEEEV